MTLRSLCRDLGDHVDFDAGAKWHRVLAERGQCYKFIMFTEIVLEPHDKAIDRSNAPSSAASTLPRVSRTAPVKAPRAWQKSSEIKSWSDRVGAFTVTNGLSTGRRAGGASGQARSRAEDAMQAVGPERTVPDTWATWDRPISRARHLPSNSRQFL